MIAGSSADAPKPGWYGISTRNFLVHGLAKSKPVTVPAPWKYTSVGPLPPSSSTVSMPLIRNVRRSKVAMEV